MNNKFYQKYKDLFYEDKRLPVIENNKNFKFQQQYHSPVAERSLKNSPNYNDNYQNHFNSQKFKSKVNMSDQSLVNIEFQSRILPKLKEYDVQIDQKIKGKDQNIFSTVNKKIFGKYQSKPMQFYQNGQYQKLNNPEEDQSYFTRNKKYNQHQSQNQSLSANKKKVRFTEPQIDIQKNQFRYDYSSEYKNSFTPLSLSAVTQVNKNLYNYEFQKRKAERKFGKRVFRFKTQQNQPKSKNIINHIPSSHQHVLLKKKLDFQQKKYVTEANQPSFNLREQNIKVSYPVSEKRKQLSFKTQPRYEQIKITQQKKIQLKQKQEKLQEQLLNQLQRLQEKYKERKKSGKFRPIAILKEQNKKIQHQKSINGQNYETQHGMSLLFSQYENQYQFVGKRLSDIKNFQRFVSHLLINNYRQALLKRVQAKKKHLQRQKKLKKLFQEQNIEYIRSKSPFQE